MTIPVPANEPARLAALRRYQILDTASDEAFERATRMASRLLRVPIALVSLVDESRQWWKSSCGLAGRETPRDLAFCAHAILSSEVMIVPNATLDARFATNPLVTGEPHIRFYAGAPLRTSDGFNLGTLCVIDTKPRELSADECLLLVDLAAVVVDQLEGVRSENSLRSELADRELAEEQTRASEAKFRAVTQSVGDAIISANAAGEIVFWNSGACKIFGHTEHEALGQQLEMIMPLCSQPMHRAGMAHYQATGDARVIGRTVEVIGLRNDGVEFPMELTLSTWNSEAGVFFTGIAHDITERKRTAEKLQRIAGIVEHSDDAIFSTSLDSTITSWNSAAERLYGYTAAEAIGTSVTMLVYNAEEEPAIIEKIKRGELVEHFETIRLRKDGTPIDVSLTISPIKGEHGTIIGASRIARDITEHLRAVAALQKEREYLAAVFENVSDGIVSCDAEGVLTMFNRATREMHGLPAVPIPAERWPEHFDLYLPDGKTLMTMEQVPLIRALQAGSVHDAELVIAPKGGSKRRLLASGQAIFDAGGKKIVPGDGR